MATRASVIFKEFGQPVMAIYKHWDGYPDNLGVKLKRIVSNGRLKNGLGPNDRVLGTAFNGWGCMFATVIASLKDSPGDVYVCKIGDVGHQGEDFVYEMDEAGNVTWKENN